MNRVSRMSSRSMYRYNSVYWVYGPVCACTAKTCTGTTCHIRYIRTDAGPGELLGSGVFSHP